MSEIKNELRLGFASDNLTTFGVLELLKIAQAPLDPNTLKGIFDKYTCVLKSSKYERRVSALIAVPMDETQIVNQIAKSQINLGIITAITYPDQSDKYSRIGTIFLPTRAQEIVIESLVISRPPAVGSLSGWNSLRGVEGFQNRLLIKIARASRLIKTTADQVERSQKAYEQDELWSDRKSYAD